MFRRFLPREVSFFTFFERHAALIVAGCEEFLSLATPGTNIEVTAKRIKELEHEADVVTHDCIEALHKTFVTPIERDDIYELITCMDDIMDFVDEATERLRLYEVRDFRPEARELAEILLKAAQEIAGAVRGLRDMRSADPVRRACVDINNYENQADTIFQRAVARLFHDEKDPIAVVKWKDIYESLELATDRCEDVANIMDGIVLEHA